MDFEDEMEAHCIRKEAICVDSNQNAKQNWKTNYFKEKHLKESQSHRVLDYIPAMLKHLSTLSEDCSQKHSILRILNRQVRFKYCLVYGTVLEKIRQKDTRYTYIIDDGTDSLEITVFRKDKDMSTISKLEKELSVIMEVSEKSITNSLRNILFATRKQLDDYNIKAGTKTLLYGRPSYYQNRVSLDVFYILPDNAPDRSIEIAFKDELVDWYKKFSLTTE